jgi:hypothetical protein
MCTRLLVGLLKPVYHDIVCSGQGRAAAKWLLLSSRRLKRSLRLLLLLLAVPLQLCESRERPGEIAPAHMGCGASSGSGGGSDDDPMPSRSADGGSCAFSYSSDADSEGWGMSKAVADESRERRSFTAIVFAIRCMSRARCAGLYLGTGQTLQVRCGGRAQQVHGLEQPPRGGGARSG